MTTEKKQEKQEAAPTPPSVTLDLPTLIRAIEDVKAIDEKISTGVGTIGKIMAEAKDAVLASAFDPEVLPSFEDVDASQTWNDLLTNLEAYRSAILEAFETAIVTEAGDAQVTHKASVQALSAEREAKFSIVSATHKLLSQMPTVFVGIDKVVLPSATVKGASSAGASSSGGGKSGGSSGVSVYRLKDDGSRQFLAKGSPLGLVAFRWFKCSAAELQSACEAAGIDTSGSWDPTEVTVGETTVKIGGDKDVA